MTKPLSHAAKALRAVDKAFEELNLAAADGEVSTLRAYECAVGLRRAADELDEVVNGGDHP